jgi:beta-glucanase (GH16 family)
VPKKARLILVVLAASTALIPSAVTASPVPQSIDASLPATRLLETTGRPAPVVVVERVSHAGEYLVTVRVSTHLAVPNVVHLRIDRIAFTASTTPQLPEATVMAHIVVRGRRFTVRARARLAAPRLIVGWQAVDSKRLPFVQSPASATDSTMPDATNPAASADPAVPVGPTGTSGEASEWHPIFDDEFNSSQLNTAYWTSGWYATPLSGPINLSDELECYARSHVVEGGGEIDLNLTATPQTCPSGEGPQNEPFTSGMVTTTGKFSFTYGFIETRVWLPGDTAVTDWPAVWAVGQTAPWPQGGEIDIVEGLDGSPCWHFHDPIGAPGGCPPGTFTAGWHTFGADWEPGSVTWYYDGTDVGTVTSGITGTPMFLLMDLAVDRTFGGAIQAPATMRVDYMRVWQH